MCTCAWSGWILQYGNTPEIGAMSINFRSEAGFQNMIKFCDPTHKTGFDIPPSITREISNLVL